MNWEPIIMPVIAIALAALGGYGWMRDLRAKFEAAKDENARRFAESENDRKDIRSKLELLDRDSVRRNDLRDLKVEIFDRVKEAEHTIRGGQATAIGEMREMIKTLLDRALSTAERRA